LQNDQQIDRKRKKTVKSNKKPDQNKINQLSTATSSTYILQTNQALQELQFVRSKSLSTPRASVSDSDYESVNPFSPSYSETETFSDNPDSPPSAQPETPAKEDYPAILLTNSFESQGDFHQYAENNLQKLVGILEGDINNPTGQNNAGIFDASEGQNLNSETPLQTQEGVVALHISDQLENGLFDPEEHERIYNGILFQREAESFPECNTIEDSQLEGACCLNESIDEPAVASLNVTASTGSPIRVQVPGEILGMNENEIVGNLADNVMWDIANSIEFENMVKDKIAKAKSESNIRSLKEGL